MSLVQIDASSKEGGTNLYLEPFVWNFDLMFNLVLSVPLGVAFHPHLQMWKSRPSLVNNLPKTISWCGRIQTGI